jgi:uncharacterized membrane protein
LKVLLQFLKTTVIGGLVFLMPVIVIIVVSGEALQSSRKVAEPLAAFIPVDSIAGIALADVIGGVVLVVLCFAAVQNIRMPGRWTKALLGVPA